MVPFELEDFFDCYEHVVGLINLASSDALPWTTADLEARGVIAAGTPFSLQYPDVNGRLLPELKRFCAPPSGIGLLPTSGAAEAISLVMHELSQSPQGMRIALPAPAYGAFNGLADLLRIPATTYTYQPERGWKPDPDEMLDLAKQCSAVIVTNPHNPTGDVLAPEFLNRLADKLLGHNGVLIVDEVFRVHDETSSAMSLGPNVVVIGSLSKTYGLPGLRLGWIAAAQDRLRRLRTIQQYITLTLGAMTVEFGTAILQRAEKLSRADLIRENRRILTDWVESCSGVVSISEPKGGTTVALALETAVTEQELFKKFKDAGVLMPPGSQCFRAYDDLRWFRLGYGTETGKLREGLQRLRGAI